MRSLFVVAVVQLLLAALAIVALFVETAEWDAAEPPSGMTTMSLPIEDGVTHETTTTLSDVTTGRSQDGSKLRSGKTGGTAGGSSQHQSNWERAVAAGDRHKVLLLAVIVGGALLARIFQLALTGKGTQGIQRARNELSSRTQQTEKEKKEVGMLMKALNMVDRHSARMEGMLERRRLDLEAQLRAFQAEKEELEKKDAQVAQRRAAVEELEMKSKGLSSPTTKDGVTVTKVPPKKTHASVLGETVARVEAELAVFDVTSRTLPRERERSALLVEYGELVKIRAATAVLDELPRRPTTPEEAKDILRARRLLLGAVVRLQSTIWASISRLLEKKGELLAEQLLAESEKIGLEELVELAEREWDVKQAQQARCTAAVGQLSSKLDYCLKKQAAIHAHAASLEKVTPEDAKQIAEELFNWESYEVTLRAQRAQIIYADVSATMTEQSFIKQRIDRVQRATDNEAERRRRLPDVAMRSAELESAISAVSEELQELQELFAMATNVRKEYEAPDPDSQSDLEAAEELEQSPVERRRLIRLLELADEEGERKREGRDTQRVD